MVNYYIYAKDFSGSTRNNRHFHSNGMKSYHQFKSDVERIEKELLVPRKEPTESKIVYLHWGTACYEVTENETVKTYNELGGNMGTRPTTIIEWIQQNVTNKNNIKLLYIITDGLIDPFEASLCFILNKKMYYETVVFHAFNTCLNRIDLSVVASFLKCQCMVYRNYELLDNVNVSKKIHYDKINLKNFKAEKENMKSYIKLKYISKFRHDALALQEIDKLKKLRDRLFAELSSKNKINLNIKNKNVFLRDFVETDWYKNLNTPSHDLKIEIEKVITTLINYIVSEKKSYSFDALKFEKTYHNPIEEEQIVDVNFAHEQEIEFPDIILDDEKGIPVILLTKFNLLDKLIFNKSKDSLEQSPASFNKFKSAMDCPLFLSNDSDISESIGYFYTLNVYKQLLTNTNKTEPRTRKPYHGGLVLIDTDEFDKYNDYILAATYFDFKKVHYNVGLFYYILWKNCENKEWMDRNVVEKFQKYVMRRISETVCKIGLSGLPLDPPHIVSLPTALWYCVELSSCVFKDDSINFMHERLRMYYGIAHCMIEILKYLNYDLDLDLIGKRRDIIRHAMILKKIPTYEEKVYYLLAKIFKNMNGFLVSEIDKPYNLSKLNYLKLDHKGMLPDDIVKEQVHLNEYVHLLHFIDDRNKSKDGNGLFDVCETTYRPFFTFDTGKTFYTELFENSKKVVISNDDDKDKIKITFDAIDCLEFDRILSVYNMFINCVKKSEKYPTLTEYMEYILKKKKYYGDLVTIFPSNVNYMAEQVYSRYQDIVTKVDVNQFIHVCKTYVDRNERIKAENIVKFSDDKEIVAFVLNEERKVIIKKSRPMRAKNLNEGSKPSGTEAQTKKQAKTMAFFARRGGRGRPRGSGTRGPRRPQAPRGRTLPMSTDKSQGCVAF